MSHEHTREKHPESSTQELMPFGSCGIYLTSRAHTCQDRLLKRQARILQVRGWLFALGSGEIGHSEVQGHLSVERLHSRTGVL